MNIPKTPLSGRNVTVKVMNGSEGIGEIVVRDTNEKVHIEGKPYSKFRIIKPKGLEKEEVFHQRDRGCEALLSVVFTALAEALRRK
ncbi:MAG: hypothetical protein FJY81_01485 [Candidatus Aminicenantes bacterium]|nr:hypothetical protein [Candidatus Aminicenantes bacterium]